MSLREIFPTTIYVAQCGARGEKLRKELLSESFTLQQLDSAGAEWSQDNYPNGYSSYSSLDELHRTSSTFGELEKLILGHCKKFVRGLGGTQPQLEVINMWLNIMPEGAYHSWHIHPHSVVSGTYYLQCEKNVSPLKFEDPKLSRMMYAPTRTSHLAVPARNNQIVLFESWLRHEVPQQQKIRKPRVSISFNLA